MLQIVKQYDEMNDVFGDPQPYSVSRDNKIHTIYLHPFRLLDHQAYSRYISRLTINKNVVGVQEAITSSYLKFLLLILPEIDLGEDIKEEEIVPTIIQNREDYLRFFYELLSDVLKVDQKRLRVEFLTKNREFGRWKVYFYVDGLKLTENDFTKMMKIIFQQNGVQQPSFEIYDAELQKELDVASQWMAEKNNGATINEQIFSYHVATGVPLSEIKEYTFYQFNKAIDRAVILKDYEVLRPLEASGQIELKNGKIDHWLSHRSSNNKYGNVVSEKSALTDALGDVSVSQ